MLAEFLPHCREKKRNCRCKTIASMDTNPIPTQLKAIDEDNGEVFFVSHRHPWAKRQGMLLDPLNTFSYNNSSQWPSHNPQKISSQGWNLNYNWSN